MCQESKACTKIWTDPLGPGEAMGTPMCMKDRKGRRIQRLRGLGGTGSQRTLCAKSEFPRNCDKTSISHRSEL